MSLKNATSSNHIRYLALATLLVCIWFLYTIHGSGGSHFYGRLGNSKPASNGPLDMMPLDEATDFCRARRWHPYPQRRVSRKIYDMVVINNEMDWLEIRLGQMADYVDHFVIVEASTTFASEDKPLYVRENYARFKKWHHKMILHTIDMEEVRFAEAEAREKFSRNAMLDQVIPFLKGEQEAFQGDVLLVSDVDEIPRPDVLVTLRNCEFPKALTLHTEMYSYGFQWSTRNDWAHPQATYYDLDKTTSPDALRESNGGQLYNAGWHCSNCFATVEELVAKIQSSSHQEYNKAAYTNPDKIVERVRNGTDLFDRADEHFDRVDNNPDIPDYLLRNKEKYSYLLDRDPPNANFRDYEVNRAS